MEKTDRPNWLDGAAKSQNNNIFVLLQNGKSHETERGWFGYDNKVIHVHDAVDGFVDFTTPFKIEEVVLLLVTHLPSKKTTILINTTLVEPKYSQ